MPTNSRENRKPAALEVGATVRFLFGLEEVTAKVIEDRGPLGRGGERIFRVRFQFEYADPIETEIEAGKLTVVEHAA